MHILKPLYRYLINDVEPIDRDPHTDDLKRLYRDLVYNVEPLERDIVDDM